MPAAIIPLRVKTSEQTGTAPFDVECFQDGLPPLEMRHPDYRDLENFTPISLTTDDRGMVDADELISVVNATVDPDYVWKGPKSLHHLYWPACQYERQQELRPLSRARDFRELKSNLIHVPRAFHSWLHVVTAPPAMPEAVVMNETIDAWHASNDFFVAVKGLMGHYRVVERERARRQGTAREFTEAQEEILGGLLSKHMETFTKQFDRLTDIPVEHWPFDPGMRANMAAGRIGQILMYGSWRKTRAVRLRQVA